MEDTSLVALKNFVASVRISEGLDEVGLASLEALVENVERHAKTGIVPQAFRPYVVGEWVVTDSSEEKGDRHE